MNNIDRPRPGTAAWSGAHRRALTGVLAALALGGGLTVGVAQASTSTGADAAGQAATSTQTAVTTYYQLVPQHSLRCADLKYTFDVPGSHNGTNVRQWQCKSAYPRQQWSLESHLGYLKIRNRYSGMCLDVEDGLSFNGTNVHQWTCAAGAANQRWTRTYVGNGYYEIHPKSSPRKCLDVEDVSQANGADIYIWTCVGGRNQHWRFARQ